MDEWVYQSNSEETIARIQCPSCPKCDQAIKLCFRYGDRIKSFYVDLISVKFEVINGELIQHEQFRHALSKWKPEILSETEQIARLKSIYFRLQRESKRRLNKDQRWDNYCRIQLTYLLSCLANDAKKKYVTSNGTVFTLPEASVNRILSRVTIYSNCMEKHAYSGRNSYYADLFTNIKHFDLIRQYLVVDALSSKFPEPDDGKQLERFGQLLDGKSKWSSVEEKNLLDCLSRKAGMFKLDISSSAKIDTDFLERLNVKAGNWFRCTETYCESVFSPNSCENITAKCPNCLDEC